MLWSWNIKAAFYGCAPSVWGKQSGRIAELGGGPERLRQRQEDELQSGDECQTWHRRIGHSGDTKC
jgi:hypothetical protein